MYPASGLRAQGRPVQGGDRLQNSTLSAWGQPSGLPEAGPLTTIPPQLQIPHLFGFVDAILPARRTGTGTVGSEDDSGVCQNVSRS